MIEINIAHAKSIYDNLSSIGNDLVLFDRFEDVPLGTEPRRMHCLFVALCLDGSAQYTVNTKEYRVHKNDVIIINDSHVIGEYMLSPDCHGVAIMSSNDFFAEIIKEVHEMSSLFLFAYSYPVFRLPEERVKTFMEYFNIIKEKVDDESHHFRSQLVMSLLKAMIYDIGNEIYHYQENFPKSTRAEAIFNDFIMLVKSNYSRERRVNWYAKQLCITPKYLSETVKAVSKQSPNEWIDYYVSMEIRVLLKNSTLSIKEIAQRMNFPNQSFLGKYFKEHVGMSPTQYRKT